MSKTLIIAEKPSVARELAALVNARTRRTGYLEGANYLVTWAVGHLVGIAEPKAQNDAWNGRWSLAQLPMLPQKFKLAVIPETAEQFEIVRGLIHREDVSEVVNATDAGREGELIFRRIYLAAQGKKPVRRLWANDMTEQGLRKSLANLLPEKDKRNLGLASFARAEADWLVGMNFSRLFTVKANVLISVGRVQTPVLRILAERFHEIETFVPQNYWTIEAECVKTESGEDASSFWATWHSPPDYRETRLSDEAAAGRIVAACAGGQAVVEGLESKRGTQKPPLPFDLTTLQREANVRFGYSAKDTLTFAQSLYEQKKCITYPRTDSRYLTKDVFEDILKSLRALHPHYPQLTQMAAERIAGKKRAFACVNDKKVADHHAIIPTAACIDRRRLSPEEWNIYEMISLRTIATFLGEAQFQTSTVHITAYGERFIAKGKIFKDRGWMCAEPWRARDDAPLPPLRKGNKLSLVNVQAVARQTKAPPHFTDASLLGAMETAGKFVEDESTKEALKERGLGTPATRAHIIETLVARGYVAKEGKKLIATGQGREAAAIVSRLMPDVTSPELTGNWEKKLKDIENATLSYSQFMQEIRELVRDKVELLRAKDIASLVFENRSRSPRPLDGTCPLCGAEIEETEKNFRCSRSRHSKGGCPFVIWKKMAGTDITESMAQELLRHGQTAQKYAFVSKAGTTFNARLKLEKGKISFDFSPCRQPKS